MLYYLRLLSVVLTALALMPAGAHLFSMSSKLQLTASDYLASQRAYDGWNLFAIVVIGLLLSLLALLVAEYRAGQPFLLTALALLCIVGTQVLFWTFTFPANQATQNWTTLPAGWEALRIQWEYSHAGSAVLSLIAFLLVAIGSIRS